MAKKKTIVMPIEDLKKVNNMYDNNIEDWRLWQIAYMGGRDFIDYAIDRHPRESEKNWIMRKKEAIVFNYARSIVDLFSFYLTEKDAMRNLGPLANDTQWKMFRRDCDLYGTNFNIFVNNAQKTSSIFGSTGILVDKPMTICKTRAQEIELGIYPYCNIYTLPNILDWKYERNVVNNRPELTYLKLLNNDSKYFLWWQDHWEIWEIPKAPNGAEMAPVLSNSGLNNLGEIPFFWFINVRSPIDPYFGLSDLTDISRITASIVRDLSSLQEIIKFAGFPMMRKPMLREGQTDVDIVGPRGVLEFDPEQGEDGKPDWLESAVADPVRGGLDFIERKIDEIYEIAHMTGIHALEKSSEARSGVALRYQFSQLSSVLSDKSTNTIEAEYEIVRLWLKWQNRSELLDNVQITRSKRFSLDDMAQDLENLLKSYKEAISATFKREIQKSMSRNILPDLPDKTREIIDEEIDSAEFPELTQETSTGISTEDLGEKERKTTEDQNEMSSVKPPTKR